MEIAARLGDEFDSLRIRARIPGLAVVILRDTTVLLARGYGYADIERQIPVTVETPFNVASVAKPISAVASLKLVEQGKLDLDARMTSFADFTEFCAAATEDGGIFFSDLTCEDLTLRHVLSMTANGIPGTRFFYNPPLFSWSSRPVAQAAGVPFSDLVNQSVFQPAGMLASARKHRRLPLRSDLEASLATPYHIDSAGTLQKSEQPGPQGDGAAGGVVSTAMDLAKFDIALTRGTLITPRSREAMWTAGRSPNGVTLPYGIGWFVTEHAGERIVWHTGLWEGAYSALYLKIPSRSLTLILLANSDGLSWKTRFDEAAVERSPFARAFMAGFQHTK